MKVFDVHATKEKVNHMAETWGFDTTTLWSEISSCIQGYVDSLWAHKKGDRVYSQ